MEIQEKKKKKEDVEKRVKKRENCSASRRIGDEINWCPSFILFARSEKC